MNRGVVSRFGATFLQESWQKRWLHAGRAFNDDELAALLAPEELDRLVLSGGLGSPDLQLISHGRAVDIPRTTSVAPATDVAHLLTAFRSGTGFRIQHLENYLPSVANTCRAIKEELGYPVRANLYVSPPNSVGLGPHYDSSEIFVVQALGSKRWRMFPSYMNQVPLPLYEDRYDVTRQKPIASPIELRLERGDLLYIPRGSMHAAATDGREPSGHITFAILGITWIDLIGNLLRRAAKDNEELRRLVPIGTEQLGDVAIADLAQGMLQDIKIDHLVGPLLGEMRAQYANHKAEPPYGTLTALWHQQSQP